MRLKCDYRVKPEKCVQNGSYSIIYNEFHIL